MAMRKAKRQRTDGRRERGATRVRRGTILVLIVSVLALISVLVVAYVAIGRSDRRSGAQAVRLNTVEDQISRIVDYHLDVIGRDAVAVFSDGWEPIASGGNIRHLIYRDARDYPFTDPARYSQPSRENLPSENTRETLTRFRFDPSGTLPPTWEPGDFIYPFPSSDPWLASGGATWLNPTVGATPQQVLANLRDRWQISNFAPDGRFVNLFNLRNNFQAEPGIGLASGRPRMTQNLTLFQASGESYPLNSSQLDFGGNARLNVPAHWTMRQRGAFRAAVEVRWPVGDGRYLHYQWADTDGDGVIDARWYELVDATDPNDVKLLLPRDGQMRWFIATQAIDLSGSINVNTATDGRVGPEDAYRLGATPSDVDLRRLLGMDDLYRWLTVDGYSQLVQPAVGGSRQDYRQYRRAEALAAGRRGFAGARYAIENRSVAGPEVNFGAAPTMQAQDRFEHYRRAGGFMPDDTGRWESTSLAAHSGLFGLMDLVELLTRRGINDDGTLSRLERAVGGRDFAFPHHSPLRDIRATTMEMAHDYNNQGQLRGASLWWAAADLRQYITTISGARPIRSSLLEYDVTDSADLGSAMANLEWRKVPTTTPPLPDGKERFIETRLDAADLLERATQKITDDNGQRSLARERDRRLAMQQIFAGYADALLPMSGLGGAWNTTQYPHLRTLHYGHDPVFALRTAAQMTVNMLDLFDGTVLECINEQSQRVVENGVTPVTVLIDASPTGRSVVQSNTQAFPWWHAQDGGGRLDLDEAVGSFNQAQGQYVRGATRRLGELMSGSDPPAPVALNMFGFEAQPFVTEAATYFMYTDTPFAAGGDQEWREETVTIGPNTQIVIIPGVVTIDGSESATNPDFLTHVVAFQVANPFDVDLQLDVNGASQYTIEFGGQSYSLSGALPRRSSKVFYAMSFPAEEVDARLSRALGSPTPTSITSWANTQFTITTSEGDVISPTRVTATAGGDPTPGQVTSLLLGTPGVAPHPIENREVLLWRNLTPPIGQALGPQHRMLADRLRDPVAESARPTLDRRLSSANHEISGTVAGHETTGNPFDNTGYSITFWGKIRRPDDPGSPLAGGLTPRGAIPAWCMELKHGTTQTPSLNVRDRDDANLTSLSKGDFSTAVMGPNEATPTGATTLLGLLTDQTAPGAGTLVRSITREPNDKKSLNETGATIPVSAQRDQRPFHELYAEAHLQDGKFRVLIGPNPCQGTVFSKIRGADMLLPLAIGAVQDPLVSGLLQDQWTTFGESLAMALGYDDPIDVNDPMRDLSRKTDRGALRLDAYVPFVDEDRNGQFNPFNDYRLGLGIPPAMKVVDIFSAAPREFGSLTRATVGTININTAPLAVLRMLPGVSPQPDTDVLGQSQQWWWTNGGHDDRSDIAATIAAYRDKSRVQPMGPPMTLDFVGLTNVPGDPTDYTGRGGSQVFTGSATRIEALREDLGFVSPAELQAVRDLNVPQNPSYPRPHDMDRLASTEQSISLPGRGGVDSIGYSTTGTGQGGTGDDQIPDDHDEQYALLNAVIGSVSTRSDYFAVWFVVHGYQRSDVETLTPNDPLVPTVARRYLMIVDRSNVVRLGDRPRILVLRELPM